MVTMVSPRSPTWWRSRLGTQTNSLRGVHRAGEDGALSGGERAVPARRWLEKWTQTIIFLLDLCSRDDAERRAEREKVLRIFVLLVALILEHYLMLRGTRTVEGTFDLCEIRRIRGNFTRTLHQIPSFSDVDRYFRHRDVLQHRQSRKTDSIQGGHRDDGQTHHQDNHATSGGDPRHHRLQSPRAYVSLEASRGVASQSRDCADDCSRCVQRTPHLCGAVLYQLRVVPNFFHRVIARTSGVSRAIQFQFNMYTWLGLTFAPLVCFTLKKVHRHLR